MNFIQRMRFFILLLGLCATSSAVQAKAGNIVSAGSLQLTAHEFGLNIAYGQPREDFIINNIQLASSILRSIAVPVEDYVGDSTSRGASVTRAIIALTRFTEEVSYMLSHPQDDHTADLAWAITDAAMICKHLAVAVRPNETAGTDEEPVTVTAEEPTVTKSSVITPVRASALLEGICGVTSSLITTNNEDQKSQRAIVFAARSTMSLLRLLRNYYATPADEKTQQQLYLGLIALQTSYAALKLSFADFAWVDCTRGYNEAGYDGTGYDKNGFNKDGFGKDGYNNNGFNASGLHKNGTTYDEGGYNRYGFNNAGMHKNGTLYDNTGYDAKGWGYGNMHRNGTSYDDNGCDIYSCNKDGKFIFQDNWTVGQSISDDFINACNNEKIPTRVRNAISESLKERACQNLGVAPSADATTIKKAYIKAARECHPDRTIDLTEIEKEAAKRRFQALNQANEILKQAVPSANAADNTMPSARG